MPTIDEMWADLLRRSQQFHDAFIAKNANYDKAFFSGQFAELLERQAEEAAAAVEAMTSDEPDDGSASGVSVEEVGRSTAGGAGAGHAAAGPAVTT